jgi:hypothetical protein
VCSINKAFKVLIALAAVSALAASAYFFSAQGPGTSKGEVRETMNSFLSEIKEGNLAGAEKYAVPGSKYTALVNEAGSSEYQDILKQVLSKMEYRIDEVDVNGSSAVAKVHISTVDLFSFYNKYSEQLNPLLKDYLSGDERQKDMVIEQFKAFLAKHVPEDIASGNYDKSEGDAEVNLVLKDGEWLVEADDSLMYYLTGRMTVLIQ